MTLQEFLTDPDKWVDQEVTLTGWLHSDCVRLWLADRPRCEDRQVVVRAPEMTRWFKLYVPPRVGGVCAYYFEAEVCGIVQPRNWEALPVLGGDVSAILQYSGPLHLRGGQAAEPGVIDPPRD